ncbi:glycoside hydrolase [Qipengyuania soli]|uniref:Glycoside hydrolase n=1 Tax=Qipengyuania soli TaxID=2782568 RepID=A0A7S8F266_9SPHN|nr:glycoside hydrolase [Qipengyuania soli]QPC99140.1 glycoside hydrolase [Qipengyuania soli]
MELTIIGFAMIVAGGWIVLAGGLRHALGFLMFSALFNGSSAVDLPALGGSSIPPVQFALLFVYLRLLLPGGGTLPDLPRAMRANRWFAAFALYGVASAFILPRMFAGLIDVAPMRALMTGDLFATVPLEPTSQNLTAASYFIGALLIVIAVWSMMRRQGMAGTMVAILVAMAWFHAVTGVVATVLRDTPGDAVFDFFRNSNYAQMDDAVGGFARIRGVLPEASTYASVGFALFVANAELWYRSVRSRRTGAAALVMGLVLFFSTSSTAYLALAFYGLVFAARTLALPQVADFRKARIALAALFAAMFFGAILLLVSPDLIRSLIDVVKRMTVEKSASDSSLQRVFWAMQGWEAFKFSWGIGIGAGSFRSSSLLYAIMGSMGVIGVVTFAMYLAGLIQPGRRSSWVATDDELDTVGGALGVAAVLSIVPAMVNSPSPVPGVMFAFLAAGSLAVRPRMVEFRRAHRRPAGQHERLAEEMLDELRQEGLARP